MKSSTHAGRLKPLRDTQICARAVNCVVDAGGDVTTATEDAGTLWLHGRIGRRSEIAPLRQVLSEIPGVAQVVLWLDYDIDDTFSAQRRAAERTPGGPGARSRTASQHSGEVS